MEAEEGEAPQADEQPNGQHPTVARHEQQAHRAHVGRHLVHDLRHLALHALVRPRHKLLCRDPRRAEGGGAGGEARGDLALRGEDGLKGGLAVGALEVLQHLLDEREADRVHHVLHFRVRVRLPIALLLLLLLLRRRRRLLHDVAIRLLHVLRLVCHPRRVLQLRHRALHGPWPV